MPELKGCHTQGESMAELMANIKEAIELCLKVQNKDGIVLAWDSDFTKLTPFERERLAKADIEIINGETIDHSKIDWN